MRYLKKFKELKICKIKETILLPFACRKRRNNELLLLGAAVWSPKRVSTVNVAEKHDIF